MMSQRYSEHYTAVCNEVEAHAAERLGRALTAQERQAIWGAGTLTWLEIRVQLPMQQVQDAADLSALLLDAADDLNGRLAEMIDSLVGMLGALLERDLTPEEQQRLTLLTNVVAVMQVGEEVAIAVPDVREAVLRDLLAGL
jgi:hypothetical protein